MIAYRVSSALSALALLACLGAAAQTAPDPAVSQVKPAQARVPLPIPRPAQLGSLAAPPASPLILQVAQTADTPVSIERINAALNAMNSLTGDFVQVNASGRRSSGKLYVQKPGKLRFEYDPPSPLEIIADGTSVAIRDRKLNTQDLYSLSQTPLKFLLRDRIDLARDTKLLDIRSEPDRTTVTIEDKSTFGGASKIALLFDKSQALRQWIVRDPQGYETTVTLSNLDLTRRLDPKLFTINYERLLSDR